MAYKDEYEVARLHSDGCFEQRLQESFEDGYQLKFHLAPPLFSKKDRDTGLPVKSAYGAWILTAMKLLAGLRRLRGTPLDIFGYTAERRLERQLISTYETTLQQLLAELTPDNHALALAIAALPEKIRGYGYVKERHLKQTQAEQAELLAAFRAPQQQLKGAA
jgi:indolepyruvate ferredoxin oxidoreductase